MKQKSSYTSRPHNLKTKTFFNIYFLDKYYLIYFFITLLHSTLLFHVKRHFLIHEGRFAFSRFMLEILCFA